MFNEILEVTHQESEVSDGIFQLARQKRFGETPGFGLKGTARASVFV